MIKKLLKEKKVTQSELAQHLGITPQALRVKINSWDSSRKGFTVPETLEIIKFLKVSLKKFMSY